MAIPAWVERLRTGVFISPSGVVSNFKVDIVSRVGGKKASNHEILNKNESIPQDQGNKATVYSIEAYFTAEDGDQESDTFYNSLREKYSISTPGVLKHPRWGDIDVMPFSFQQVETLVTGAGVFRVPVVFREIPPSEYPTPSGIDQSEIIAEITELESTIEQANESIDVSLSGDYADFEAKTTEIVDTVDFTLSDIITGSDEIEDQFNLIKDDIARALADGDSAVQVLSQIVNLIRVPSQIVDTTLSKVKGYSTMISGIANSFINVFTQNSNVQEKLNNARMAESILNVSVSVMSEAALFTDYTTRDAAGDALDFINDSHILVEQNLSEIYQILDTNVVDSFEPNHNTNLEITILVGKTNSILIDRSFDLKAKQITILTAPSDAITLTWKFYKDMTQLEFFINTNNLTNNEIIEIPSGREIIAYV